jgi:DNA ligase-associated metallophosphoesterase
VTLRASTMAKAKRERTAPITISDVAFTADLSGALYWDDERLLVVSDLHLEKGSSFAVRGILLPPFDTAATLAALTAAIACYDPRTVIALGDSFHDRDAHERLADADRGTIAALQAGRDWIWIEGNHDPLPPASLRGSVATEIAWGPITFRHEPTGASGEIAGHLHPKAKVATRGRGIDRRCFVSDGSRAVMPSFGAYTGGLSIRDRAFAKVFGRAELTVHVLGDTTVHLIAGSQCY